MENPAARFKVISAPTRPPGHCFFCRSSNNGPFIDTGLEHDHFLDAPNPEHDGTVYICKACVEDFANTMNATFATSQIEINSAYQRGYSAGIDHSKKKIHDVIDSLGNIVGIEYPVDGSDDTIIATIHSNSDSVKSEESGSGNSESDKGEQDSGQDSSAGSVEGQFSISSDPVDELARIAAGTTE